MKIKQDTVIDHSILETEDLLLPCDPYSGFLPCTLFCSTEEMDPPYLHVKALHHLPLHHHLIIHNKLHRAKFFTAPSPAAETHQEVHHVMCSKPR